MTGLYMAEMFAINKALDLYKSHNQSWSSVNICTDSLSFLRFLDNSQHSLFPSALVMNQSIAELIYRINKFNYNEQKVRFSWCPAHAGINFIEKRTFWLKRRL